MTGALTTAAVGTEATGTPAVYAAMVCAGAAVWLMTGRNGGAQRARLLLAGEGEPVGRGRPLAPPVWWREAAERARRQLAARLGPAGWCLPAGLLVALLGRSWIPLAAGFLAVPAVRGWLGRRNADRLARSREAAVVELCASVAGELRAGRQPGAAVLAADRAVLERFGDAGAAVLAAARFGGDVAAALREAAALPGADGLSGAAACWQVAVDGGAGLADGLERVAASLRAGQEQREELRAQLAGPRSTALVLALLPVFGLVLGSAMEADPLEILLHTPAGFACLVAGLVLEWAGLAWVARIVRSAEGAGRPRRTAATTGERPPCAPVGSRSR
ncbi:type II secretion system F family protein [Streptomyces tubbatahanensis]|uniref:Type II secretion system F family protein n=1 Tax=Streptomyces tubbatahanensis TaxID=2923272 RepID=A0ABY3XUZ3_9ACTN|nr:type II secretion system F family protein [Streptomyces tubbatahanensis]UNS98165.1 type II secretion system F family protein [Streptomyces tubbatahanensis]